MNKQLTAEQTQFVNALKAKGYAVYIADVPRGFYGFYTKDGDRLVSFQLDFLLSVSGNYVTKEPRQCGQGWRIVSDKTFADVIKFADRYYDDRAPRWATKGVEWRYKTVAEHLDQYGRSSNYVKQ